MIDWDSVPGEVITVISDLHSNKRAVGAAMKAVKQKRCDQLVILGDILTYGIDVNEVTDMVGKAIDDGAWLLMGNHDEMYLDLIGGHCEIFSQLRPDLQESINYNLARLDTKLFASWAWQKQIVHHNVYYSHANPYGNCWDYVKTIPGFHKAALKIQEMGHLAGVFGHSHRNICFSHRNQALPYIDGLENDIFVLNPGSIGQPRSRPTQATLLRLSSHKNKLWAEVEPVDYDMSGHVDSLLQSSLSAETKLVLASFF
jgi:predicted phosphodiesterase